MACCPDRTIGSLEIGDFSSSLTMKRNHYAVNCGYKGVVNRHVAKCDSRCSPLPRPLIDAVQSSSYLDAKVAACKTTYVGNKALTSQEYTRNLQLSEEACGDRFASYTRKFVLPCPPDPPEYTNSVLPKPSFNICQPSRQGGA